MPAPKTLYLGIRSALKITSNFKFKMFAGNLIINLNIKNLDKHFMYYLIDLLFIIEKAI